MTSIDTNTFVVNREIQKEVYEIWTPCDGVPRVAHANVEKEEQSVEHINNPNSFCPPGARTAAPTQHINMCTLSMQGSLIRDADPTVFLRRECG